jgi:two-component system sensor histidine kinase KdpD
MASRRSALLPLSTHHSVSWRRSLQDLGLALVGVLLVTGVIAFFQLYPRISTSSLIYLLVVLTLAALRGRVAAILAAVLAFCAFNFFLVPPLYTFVVGSPDDLIALFVFLATAIITGQLASALRARAEEAREREQETQMLYELGQAVQGEEEFAAQLSTVVRAVVNVFSVWGIHACALLLPGNDGTLRVEAQAVEENGEPGPICCSREEQAAATWVMHHQQTVDVRERELTARREVKTAHRVVIGAQDEQTTPWVRLVPLLSKGESIGVLRLFMRSAQRGSSTTSALGTDRSHQGSSPAFFWTFVDQITFLIVQMRLRHARLHIQALQETDQLTKALLSSVSHDLRTPLSTMKAATSSLLSEDMQWDEESRRSFLLAIDRELDRLNRLVGNLLDLSRIEGNALKPEKEWYLIDELIRDVLDRLQPLLQDREVQTSLPVDLPPVELDYLALDQVLTNLIENAVHYTPASSLLEISAQREGEEVKISVADRGPGIPEAALERIFDKFYRVQGTRDMQTARSGSGLGLAVCRGLVEAHAGRIWAENRAGGGAVFHLTLPTGKKEERNDE